MKTSQVAISLHICPENIVYLCKDRYKAQSHGAVRCLLILTINRLKKFVVNYHTPNMEKKNALHFETWTLHTHVKPRRKQSARPDAILSL